MFNVRVMFKFPGAQFNIIIYPYTTLPLKVICVKLKVFTNHVKFIKVMSTIPIVTVEQIS